MDKKRKNLAIKVLLVLILLAVIATAVVVAIYAFKDDDDNVASNDGCEAPILGPHGSSNWTTGADTILFGCVGQNVVIAEEVISRCIDGSWVPPGPPPCIVLPIRYDCPLQGTKGIEGTLSIWQLDAKGPTNIYGILTRDKVDPSARQISEVVLLANSTTCTTSTDFDIVLPEPLPSDPPNSIEVRFSSHLIVGFREAQVHITLIFLDPNSPTDQPITFVAVIQDGATLVMPRPIETGIEWSASASSVTATEMAPPVLASSS